MAFEAVPGLEQPGLFHPGALEQVSSNVDVSGSDTSASVDTHSLAVSLSDADTSSATETNSLAVAISGTDTGSGTETESIVVQVSSSDTSSATETESTSVPVSDSDTSSATETESLAVTLSDSDTGSSTETHSLAASFEDSDTSTGTEIETLAVELSDADSMASAETESATEDDGNSPTDDELCFVIDSESVTATLPTTDDVSTSSESHSIEVLVSSSDTGASSESNDDIPSLVTGSDTSAATETHDIVEGAQDTETVSAAESHSIAVTLTSSDGAGTTESQTSPGQSLPTIGNYQATLVMGPATVYVADYGTAIPDNTDPLGGSWVDLGGTLGGVVLTCVQEFEQKPVTQKVDNPASRMKTRDLKVETVLAEPVLANLLYALNQGSITTGVGYKSYEPPMIDRATPLTYRTIIIDGWSPGIDPDTNRHMRRRIVLRKALSTDGTTLNYSKENQTGQEVAWSVHYVDSSTAPFKVIDEQ